MYYYLTRDRDVSGSDPKNENYILRQLHGRPTTSLDLTRNSRPEETRLRRRELLLTRSDQRIHADHDHVLEGKARTNAQGHGHAGQYHEE